MAPSSSNPWAMTSPPSWRADRKAMARRRAIIFCFRRIAFWPAILFVLPAHRARHRAARKEPAIRFLLAWAGGLVADVRSWCPPSCRTMCCRPIRRWRSWPRSGCWRRAKSRSRGWRRVAALYRGAAIPARAGARWRRRPSCCPGFMAAARAGGLHRPVPVVAGCSGLARSDHVPTARG